MARVAFLVALFALLPGAGRAQAPSTLHITVTLVNAAGAAVPVPRHALLISDNPATSAPRRVVTRQDGTADVPLHPGNFTVESDAPTVFEGKGYEWAVTLDVAVGDAFLKLTADNAEIGTAPAASAAAAPSAPIENDPAFLLPQWKDSVVAVWTPTSRASGFVIDSAGLVVTNQRGVAGASSAEVQLTPSVKVAARILVADAKRDVAVLAIDPEAARLVRPIPLSCADAAKTPLANGQRLITIGAPLHREKDAIDGEVIGGDPPARVADFRLGPGSAGGPVFNVSGSVVGLSSPNEDQDGPRRRDARVVPVADVCEVVTSAEAARPAADRPSATRLPVEPLQPFPQAVLESAPDRRGNLTLYQTSSSNFEITFVTPMLAYAMRRDTKQASRGSQGRFPAPTDFGDWSEYFADNPAVLAIRVTPKLTENFWMTIARGAASTQGMNVPAIKRVKAGFSRLRAFCGDAEVLPIHPFVLEQRVSDTDVVREGLYVFDPLALGPQCKAVKLMLYSEKEPGKADTKVVDPPLVERIGQDFASYRDRNPGR